MKRITIANTVFTLLSVCFIVIILSAKKCDECFSPPVMMIKFFICGLVIFIGSIYHTLLYLKNEKIIFNIETLPLLETNEASSDVPFSGEGEVMADSENLLHAPYSNNPCVYYHSITERYVQRGKSGSWEIVENLVDYVPFFLKDKRGRLKIDLTNVDNDFSSYKMVKKGKGIPDPEMSEVDCTTALHHEKFTADRTILGFIPSAYSMRRSEYVLMPSTKIFVYGYVSNVNGELVLHEDPKHPLLISEKTKDSYVKEFYQGGNLIFFVHLLLSIGYTISVISMNYFLNMPHMLFLISLLIGNLGISGSIIFTMYNRIITLKERASVAVSNIDVELKRRADLIPRIVSLVKEYTRYEKNLFEMVAIMRVQLTREPQSSSEKTSEYARLIGLVEKYPELKASSNYQHLMTALVDTEERIAYSRAFYNRNVRKLNTLITQFPFIIISSLFQIKQMDYLTIVSDEIRE